jgi:hypothetical protein
METAATVQRHAPQFLKEVRHDGRKKSPLSRAG